MSIVRSGRGKPIDMGQLAAQHENVRAVGNMSVNARGDHIDSANQVVKTKSATVQEQYKETVTEVKPVAKVEQKIEAPVVRKRK